MGLFDYVFIRDREFQTKSIPGPCQREFRVGDGYLYMEGERYLYNGSLAIDDRDHVRGKYELWMVEGVVHDYLEIEPSGAMATEEMQMASQKPIVGVPRGLASMKIGMEDMFHVKGSRGVKLAEAIAWNSLLYYPKRNLFKSRISGRSSVFWMQFGKDRITPKVDLMNGEVVEE